MSAYAHMRKCVRTHKTWHSFPLYAAVRILDDPQFSQQLRTYIIGVPFLNQKTFKDIRIS